MLKLNSTSLTSSTEVIMRASRTSLPVSTSMVERTHMNFAGIVNATKPGKSGCWST